MIAQEEVRFEMMEGPGALNALEVEWNDLCRQAEVRNSSQTPYWAKRAWQFRPRQQNGRLKIIVGRQHSRLVLVLPFVIRRQFLWRRADWLGLKYDYRDIVVAPSPQQAAWIAAAWALAKNRLGADLLWCPSVAADSLIIETLAHEASAAVTRFPACYVPVDTWPDWQSYQQNLSSNLRQDLGRRLRRLKERGQVTFRMVDSPSEVKQTLDWMYCHKRAWLERRGLGRSWYSSDRFQDFYHAVALDALACGELVLAVLAMEGQPIAAELGFRRGSDLESVLSTYDFAWRSYGPGLLLIEMIVRWAFEQGGVRVDFRAGNEPFKRRFLPQETFISSFLVPCTLLGAGVTLWTRSALRRVLKSGFDRMPVDVGNALRAWLNP